MRNATYRRALQRAAEILGGDEALALHLNIGVESVRKMLGGTMLVPPQVFLIASDVVGDQSFRETFTRSRAPTGTSFA
jgi:hypothetical protein